MKKNIKLGELFEIGSGGTPSKKHPEYYGGDIPWVKTGDLKSEYLYEVEDYITDIGLKNSSARIYEPETVLIAMYGATIGATSILKFPACTNQACAAFKPNHLVRPEYLYYFLTSRKQQFIKDGVGGAQPNISANYLKKVAFTLIDVKEQDEIIKILNKVSSVIQSRKLEIEKLDELIKARFVELFDDSLSPIKTVEEMCSAIVDCPHTTPKYEGDLRNPAIRTSEIKKGYITWDTMRYVSDEEYEERVARLRPKAGDIVYGREGTFGNAAILPEGYKFCLGQRVMLLRPDYSKCTSEYLLHAVISDDVYRQAVGKNNASTVAHVNVKDVKQFRVPLPSFEKQNEFAAFVKQVENVKYAVKESLTEIQTLFDSLMQEYFG